MRARWSRAALAALLLAEAPMIQRALRAVRVREMDLEDLTQEVVLRVLRATERGTLVLPDRPDDWPGAVRAYLWTTSRRLGRAQVGRYGRERASGALAEEVHDPGAWLEARSELRAIEVPAAVLPLLMALAEGSDLASFAREMGIPVGTAHDRVRRFRRGRRARGGRSKGRRDRR